MAGDALSTTAQYFYKSPASNQPGGSALNDLLVSLAQSIMGSGATNGVTKASAGNITGQLASNTPLSNIVSPHASGTDNIPKAYLSVLFFDERFNFVSEGSTSQRVSGADNSNAALTLANIKAPKNGYAYIYVSNESDEYVYFDNVKVAHTRGRIIEENHYYAFGLKIAGISSKKLGDDNEGSLRNEYGYNDKELWEEGDLNWLDYGFRNYDPQIGRFLQIDPLSDEYADLSPYLYAYNDPIANVDEDGLAGANAVAQIFTGAGAQAAADAARMAGNNLGEVVVKSTIKKAASKSLGKIILSKIVENSASLLGSLLIAGNDIVDKGKEIYNRVSLNITLEDARTGKSFFERFLERTIRLENIGLGGGGLGLAEEVLKLEIRYSTVAAGELKTGVSLTASGVGTADLYRVVGSGIVYSTSLEKSGGNSSGSSNTPIKYKKPKSNISGKEGAKDVPSWARGEKPIEGENGDRFARRLLDKKYGKGNYSSKSQTEYSKIQKWGDRAFE